MPRALTFVLGLAVAALPAVAGQALPPDEEGAKAALESSPRHGEWVDISYTADTRIRSFVVYPERPDSAGVVIVIHGIDGLTDWIRAVGDRLASEGFIAVAPDLLSGLGPQTDTPRSRDETVALMRELSSDEVRRRLDSVRNFAVQIPSGSGLTATMGFGWGGSQSFAYATDQPSLDAAIVYYGSAPEDDALVRIEAPVLGLFGGDDARVNATIPAAAKKMKSLRKTFEVEVYEGAGHGFLRSQQGREGANRKAAEKAWPRTLKFLRQQLVDEAF